MIRLLLTVIEVFCLWGSVYLTVRWGVIPSNYISVGLTISIVLVLSAFIWRRHRLSVETRVYARNRR